MSDKFYPLAIQQIYYLIKQGLKKNRIFGIPKELFYNPAQNNHLKSNRFSQALHTPLGVAAGPHTQLSQNIISSWLTGARYIELKTIQTLDELEISKPCIDMQDEGYNCEWSQELKINQSYLEYLNAWILLHILNHEMHGNQELGTIFNMSVGYDYEGIQKENVQWFFEKMKDSSAEKNELIEIISEMYPAVKNLSIPDTISNNVTLSTMHGCPPDEIEKIGKYLIEEKKLHTTIKLNPTLLGPDMLRYILNEKLAYKTHVPDDA
ncbi:MAG: putative selenate reductase subunit YgfK, partial [Marinilabiliales bacterium]